MARYEAAPYVGPPNSYGDWETTKTGIAIHATANDATAENEARYAKRRTDETSSHFYVDHDSVIQSLDTKFLAWHAGNDEGNTRAIAVEITGENSWSKQRWLDEVDWNGLVDLCAWICITHNIPAQRLSVTQMRFGSAGIYTHNDMRLAWGGTDHTDPGPNFPMDYLIARIRDELEEDMEQEDQLICETQYDQRHVGNVLADLSNLRDWLIGETPTPHAPGGAPISPTSPLGKILTAAEQPPAVIDANDIAQALRPIVAAVIADELSRRLAE